MRRRGGAQKERQPPADNRENVKKVRKRSILIGA